MKITATRTYGDKVTEDNVALYALFRTAQMTAVKSGFWKVYSVYTEEDEVMTSYYSDELNLVIKCTSWDRRGDGAMQFHLTELFEYRAKEKND